MLTLFTIQAEKYKHSELLSTVTEIYTIDHTHFSYALWGLTEVVLEKDKYQDPAGVRVTQNDGWIICVS